MVIALAPIGADLIGTDKAVILGFTVGLLLTFVLVRVNTRLIRANVSWWFHDIEKGGTHIHHMVFGVVIMVASGLLEFALTPGGFALQFLAFAFGAGVALTLDEFALILHLEDVYWQEEGRLSVDAVIVAASAGLLTLLIGPPLTSAGISGASGWLLAGLVVVDLSCSVVSILKGKLWTGFVGIWIPVVAQVGAIRLARPGSPWARKRYANRAEKQARAEVREQRGRRYAEALKRWFYDLIAGKPSLPPLAVPDDEPAERE